MTDEHRMEQLSRAYVQAVAAVSGCACARPEPDYGVDLSLRLVDRIGGEYCPIGRNLDVQLKSTTAAVLTAGHVIYDLDVRAYDMLRRATRRAPMYLVLFVMPAERSDWVAHSESGLEIRHCAYWLSLRREPAVTNAATVRVRVPRQNQFTPAALARIMEALANEEDV